MSRIFELFGYPLSDQSAQTDAQRRSARCPFMGLPCDGGGNRPQSNIRLKTNPELAAYFSPDVGQQVASGVCSLQLNDGQTPWIICPRRLLFLGKSGEDASKRAHQSYAENLLLRYSDFPVGSRVGVWSEVKMKYEASEDKSFDYTFDYVLMQLSTVSQKQVEQETGQPWLKLRKRLQAHGYAIIEQEGENYVEGFPVGPPLLVEIMTSSTSGGNKDKRTTIPMAFEDALLRDEHQAPGINYRQVWARMVSQLIVKSEVGLAWGGKTIWVLQDRLVDYISRSTALDVRAFRSDQTNEVNMLAFAFDEEASSSGGLGDLMFMRQGQLYSGPIQPPKATHEPSFQDMIRTAVTPPVSALFWSLSGKAPANILHR